jgi:hypothetical protein
MKYHTTAQKKLQSFWQRIYRKFTYPPVFSTSIPGKIVVFLPYKRQTFLPETFFIDNTAFSCYTFSIRFSKTVPAFIDNFLKGILFYAQQDSSRSRNRL